MSFFESIFYMAWRGLAIGLIISAPMGPVGMLCIQRTLHKGRRAGFYTGVGAAISDFFYCLLTGLGLSFIEDFLEKNSNIIQLAGSAVLIAFGVYLFRQNPSKKLRKPDSNNVSKKKSILGGFFFTFSNPLILFLTIGLFARFNFLMPEFHVHQYITGYIFIFFGALLWWWLITFTVDKVRSHFNIRSMWLINKIIGVIILMFAVVGIISSTIALANARELSCWNASRGYESFHPSWETFSTGEPGRIANSGSDTLFLLTPLQGAVSADFRLKARNHNALSEHRQWGLAVRDTAGRMACFRIGSEESSGDPLSSTRALTVNAGIDGVQLHSASFADNNGLIKKIKGDTGGPDPTGALNFFKLSLHRGSLALFGGIHSPEKLVEISLPGNFIADSIGIFLLPGAELTFSEMSLSNRGRTQMASAAIDMARLEDYLEASSDPMECRWRILDRSLDEDLLRQGGDYLLATVKSETSGYDLIYLSGARVNPDDWQPGMLKGRISPSDIAGVWNVEWIDANGASLHNEIKAQRDSNGTLSIQFPYQNSTVRLHPVSP